MWRRSGRSATCILDEPDVLGVERARAPSGVDAPARRSGRVRTSSGRWRGSCGPGSRRALDEAGIARRTDDGHVPPRRSAGARRRTTARPRRRAEVDRQAPPSPSDLRDSHVDRSHRRAARRLARRVLLIAVAFPLARRAHRRSERRPPARRARRRSSRSCRRPRRAAPRPVVEPVAGRRREARRACATGWARRAAPFALARRAHRAGQASTTRPGTSSRRRCSSPTSACRPPSTSLDDAPRAGAAATASTTPTQLVDAPARRARRRPARPASTATLHLAPASRTSGCSSA